MDWNLKPIFTQKVSVCRHELGRFNPPNSPDNSNTAFRRCSLMGWDLHLLNNSPKFDLSIRTAWSPQPQHIKRSDRRWCNFVLTIFLSMWVWRLLTLWRPLLPYGCSYPVPDWAKRSFVILDIGALWGSALSARVPRCQKLQMTAITNDGLTRSGTGCFIAVPMQQWASKG